MCHSKAAAVRSMGILLSALATACVGNAGNVSSLVSTATDVTVTCPAPDACHIATKDPQTGACTVLSNAKDGTACDDHNLCTVSDTCQQGTCVAGAPAECVASDKCKTATCDPTLGCQVGPADPWCSPKLVANPMQGCWLSTYSIPVTIENTTFGLVLDTGSGVMAIASNLCTTCSAVAPTFSYTDPNYAFVDPIAAYGQSYGDGSSWNGVPVKGPVTADAAVGPVTMNFVEIFDTNTTSQHQFFQHLDCELQVPNYIQGIVGADFQALSPNGPTNFMDSIALANKVPDVFGVQLCDRSGFIWYGGYDPAHTRAPAQYVAMTDYNDWYGVQVASVGVGGARLPAGVGLPDKGIVDTGASIISLPPSVFEQAAAAIDGDPNFLLYFPKSMMATPTNCVTPLQAVSRQALDDMLPRLTIELTDAQGHMVKLDLPATSSYLQAVGSGAARQYCSALTPGGMITLGAAALQNHVVVFDRAGKRLGFAPQAGCPAAP